MLYDIVIIGAGPAGISMAVESTGVGLKPERILVIERSAEHSFSIRKYYPDKKLVTANYKGFQSACTGALCIPDLTKHETITYLDKAISDNNINVNYNETVWKIFYSGEDSKERFTVFTDKSEYKTKTIAIAIGILGKPNKPAYKIPLTLKDRALFDITTAEIMNSRVLVVGGGDSASEYCQFLVQDGNDVTLSYRRAEFSRMNDINRESLLALGREGRVKLFLNSDIISLEDQTGRPVVTFSGAEECTEEFDYVIYALGGTTPHNFLKSIGIEFNGDEPVLKEGYETSVPGMFLLGDLSAGTKGGSIIWAFNSANTAMKRICRKYLESAENCMENAAE
ncbi:MAG: NAD(P)-binding domain-containing protein [Bacteroidota bacterium]